MLVGPAQPPPDGSQPQPVAGLENGTPEQATPDRDAPEDETVLARLNDPAPQFVEDDEERSATDPNERLDDPTVLAHINGPSQAGERVSVQD